MEQEGAECDRLSRINVQGYELLVLKGAERILRENKGRIRLRFEYMTRVC